MPPPHHKLNGRGGPPMNTRREAGGLRKGVAEFFELPKEIVLDLPKITMVGDLQMIVENHRGIVEYSSERVVIAVSDGHLVLTGEELMIGFVYQEEITITGRFRRVEFCR